MADIRVKDLSNTATTVAADAFHVVDGVTNGTEKISRDNLRADLAGAFEAAPGTYNLAPLVGGAVAVARGGTGSTTAAGARTNLEVNSIDEDAQANGTKVTAPSMYFNGSSSYVTVADDDKLTFSSLTEFGKTTAGTWSPEDNTPALTDGTGTLNDHYKIDADGTVAQGGSTLSIINGASVTAGQVVYYDGSVWRLKDVDDLPFSVSALVNATDWTNFGIAGKYSNSADAEWLFYTNGDSLAFYLNDSNPSNRITCATSASLTAYEGQWIHVAVSYAGAGPSAASGNAFTAADAGVKFFINGTEVAQSAAAKIGTYSGMQNTSLPLHIGKYSTAYAKGSIRDCKLFNRELTASEVAQLARGNDLGFSEEWGGALGGVEDSDFSAGTDSYLAGNSTVAGNIDSIGGVDDTLRLTIDTTSNSHFAYKSNLFTRGKRYRVGFDFFVPSSNTALDGISVLIGTSNATVLGAATPTPDTWTSFSAEAVANASANADRLLIYATDGGVTSFSDGGAGTDVFYIKNVTITEIGALADFRAERYDTSTNKLYDISDNAFVGTGTSVSLTGREQPVYETGTWTPTITFGGGSTGVTYGQQQGNYTRIGRIVYVSGYFVLTSKGTDTGSAKINGLPFTAVNLGSQTESFVINRTANMASLTSAITGNVDDNASTFALYDHGAAGSTTVDDTNFTNTSAIRFSGTYQIQ